MDSITKGRFLLSNWFASFPLCSPRNEEKGAFFFFFFHLAQLGCFFFFFFFFFFFGGRLPQFSRNPEPVSVLFSLPPEQ
jgi:hypothetical protein